MGFLSTFFSGRSRVSIRQFSTLFGAVAAAMATTTGNAQQFPTRAVRVIAPFAAGGGADLHARLLASALSERMGQPFLVENRGGAGGNVGMDSGAKAAPDGYTQTLVAQSLAANPYLYAAMPFDPIRDFSPVAHISNYDELLVVSPDLGVNSVKDLLALAKSKPDSITFGTSGAGGLSHLTAELLMSLSGVKLVHVPYKGAAPAFSALLAGEIKMGFFDLSLSTGAIKAGRIRPLGISGATRDRRFPEIPAINEIIPGYSLVGWYGWVLPARTPRPIVDQVSAAIVAALKAPPINQKLTDAGFVVIAAGPADFGELIRKDMKLYEKLVKDGGIKPE